MVRLVAMARAVAMIKVVAMAKIQKQQTNDSQLWNRLHNNYVLHQRNTETLNWYADFVTKCVKSVCIR